MLGMADVNTDMMSSKLEETLNIIKKVNQQFKNPVNFHKHVLNKPFNSRKNFYRTDKNYY